uniref:Uncharacterized protein n=1 Tax=Ciona savignyi TaxID=51511 RepID=H2Z7T2_CIOSA
MTSIRQVPSPLSIPAYTDSGTINRVSVTTSYSHPITVSSSKEQNRTSQSSKTLILSQPAETNTNTIKEISLHTQRVNAMNSLPQLTPRVSFTTSVMTPSTTYTVTKTPHFSTPVSIIVKPTSSAQELKLEAQKINNVPGRNIFEQFSPPMLQTPLSTHIPIAASPVAPGKLTVAGTKRSHSITPPSFSYSSSPHTRWPTPNSPSPAKKTRTLAEIKAQMKARKAAAASNTRPQLLPVQAQGVVANTASHIFSATTFPVYFPVVSEQCSKVAAAIPASRHTTPGYVRVNATLPLEKVQWISHPGTPQGPRAQTPKLVSIPKSTVVHNHNVVGPAQIIKPNHQVVPPISKDTPTTKKTVQNSVNQKGKIILKIKTAGSAISLKVDADVIKKEFNRSTSSNDEDHESEEEDSRSDDSHDHKKLCKKKNKRSISSGGSSDSETDICKPNKRWCPDDLDTGQPGMRFHESKSDPSSSTSATTMLVKANTASPVFGVSPYSVNVAPAMTETPCHRSITSSTLFNQKTNS